MRKTALLALFALLAVIAVPALAGQPVDGAAPAVAADTADAEALPLFVDEAEPAVTVDATQGAVETAKIPPPWCPYGAPTCNDNDDCDNYCGDPRFGYCFTDTRCCGCTG